MRKSSKCQKHAVQRVGENVQQHTDHIFWKIFMPAHMSNSFEDFLQQVVNGEVVFRNLKCYHYRAVTDKSSGHLMSLCEM